MKTVSDMKNLSLATGAALALAAFSGSAMAETANPFGMTDLSQGYQLAMNGGKCGEGKCGGSKPKPEGKCGEGKCGGSKPMGEGKCGEGKCGGSKPAPEGKCGEGKCGGSK